MGIPGGANPLLLRRAAAAADADPYLIEQSLLFNPADNPALSRTFLIGNRRIWTFSCWAKRCGTGSVHRIMSSGADSDNYFLFEFSDDDYVKILSKSGGSNVIRAYTSGVGAVYRDPSAWYSLVLAIDTTQVTAADRIKLYVNGKDVALTLDTTPDQNLETEWLDPSNTHKIGQNGWDAGGDFDGYLANVEFIDGLQLSSAAFGSYDSSGCWTPSSFSIPAPNNGTTWSDNVTCNATLPASGADSAAEGFDGDGGTAYPNATRMNTFTSSSHLTVSFGSSGIKCNQSVEIPYVLGSGSIVANYDVTFKDGHVESRYIKGPSGSGASGTFTYFGRGSNVTEFKIRTGSSSGNGVGFGHIKIDGVELVDGQTDTETRLNPNNGTEWSESRTGDNSWHATDLPARAFDGKNVGPVEANPGNNYTFTFGGGISNVGTIDLDVKVNSTIGTDGDLKINGTSIFNAVKAAVGDGVNGWYRVPASIHGGNLNSLYGGCDSGGANVKIYGVKVNGNYLVDNVFDNSFQLKFADKSLTRYLGKDTFNGKISNATGALPIYNTTDLYGDVKGSGNRTDSDSGNLDLAIAGDAFTDSSGNSVNVSGSGAVVSTTQSRFYGSSIFFDGSNDYINTAGSLWSANGDQTFEAWVWANTIDSGNGHVLFDTNGQGQLHLVYSGSPAKKQVAFHPADSNYAVTDAEVPEDEWVHIAFTQTSTTRTVFINGVKATSYADTAGNAQTAAWNNPTGTLRIGHNSNNNRAYFNGYMQDIRVYDKVKYTQDFIPPNRKDFGVTNLIGPSVIGADMSEMRYYPTTNNNHYWWPYSIEYSDDNSSWTEAWNGNYGTYSGGTCQQKNGTGGGSSNGVHKYWRMKVGTTNAHPNGSGGHPPRVARLELVDTAGGVHSLLYSTGDNCSDNGHISTAGDTITLSEITSTWTASDAFTDSPTNYLPDGGTDGAGGVTRGNYATLNPLELTYGTMTFAQGNLKATANANWCAAFASIHPKSGKFYWEVTPASSNTHIGVQAEGTPNTAQNPQNHDGNLNYYGGDGKRKTGTTYTAYGASYGLGDVIGVALDLDSSPQTVTYYKNNSSQGTLNLSLATGIENSHVRPAFYAYNAAIEVNFGAAPFKYSAPANHTTLCTQNLPDLFGANSNAAEDKNTPSKYFDILTFTGTGAGNGNQKITFPFAPDLVWTKQRNAAASYGVYDRVRGTNSKLYLNTDGAANTNSDAGPASWDSDGVTLDDVGDDIVYNGGTGIAFAWDAGTGSASTNNSGSNNATIACDYLVNQTAGFSIATYTGTDDGSGTNNVEYVYHGLGTAPDFVVIKSIDGGYWMVKHKNLTSTKNIILHDTHVETQWGSGYIGDLGGTNSSNIVPLHQKDSYDPTNHMGDGEDYVMYSWFAVPQFSAFGTLEGNGNSNGPFCHTGMTPSWILFKNIESTQHWQLVENVTDTLNPGTNAFYPNLNNAMETNDAFAVDFLSNGFKIRNTNSTMNTSGHTYVYAAFTGTNPFKTARAR